MTRPVVRTVGLVMLALLAVARAADADVTPQRKWQQLQSPHFRVMGDATDRQLRQVAEHMEQLHELLAMQAKGGDERSPDTTVLVFRDVKAYSPFLPRFNDKPVEAAGYFVAGPMNYITLLAGTEGERQSVVYHEYTHVVSNRAVGAMPPWVAEGLAEFYSTFEVGGGGKTANLGGMLQRHLWTLQKQMLPLATLAAVTHDSPIYNERDTSSVFYAESWALIHYLQFGKQRKYGPKFVEFLAAVTRDTPFDEACTSILGVTVETLEKELRAYVFGPVLYRAIVPLPDRISKIAKLVPSPVSEADVHATLGDVLTRLDGRPEARAHLEHAVSVDGRQSLALAALADLSAEAGELDCARALARRAGSGPTYLSEYYRAVALERVAGDDAADDAEIVTALRRSIALNQGFAVTHVMLANHLANSIAGRDEALQLVRRAVSLEPSRDEYRLSLGRIQILKGDTKAARATPGPLAAKGSTQEVMRIAREYLGYAARAETTAGDSGAPFPPGALPPPSTGALPANAKDSGLRLDLRAVGAGESRVAGTINSIECGTDGLVIVATVGGPPLRLRAAAFNQVDFVSYREDRRGSIACGPQTPTPVLITYRQDANGTTAGVAVAVEYVPDGYRPQ